jgi:hypothetical protein
MTGQITNPRGPPQALRALLHHRAGEGAPGWGCGFFEVCGEARRSPACPERDRVPQSSNRVFSAPLNQTPAAARSKRSCTEFGQLTMARGRS